MTRKSAEKTMKPSKILFVCGGTGGHVYPALAVADAVKRIAPETPLLFVGNRGGFEQGPVRRAGYRLRSVWMRGFQRGRPLLNLRLLVMLPLSLLMAFRILMRERPSCIFATGGYVCVPVLLAALLLGTPSFLHDSNAYPGLTVRRFARSSSSWRSLSEINNGLSEPPPCGLTSFGILISPRGPCFVTY